MKSSANIQTCKVIRLEGKGFGGGKQTSAAKVSGTSKDYIRGIAGLCEGRIEGLPNGAKDITLNGTPLQNEDGSFNFEDFNWDIRLGTKDQAPFPNGLNEISIENSINVEVTKALSATRTIVNDEATALRVRIAIQLDNNGQEDKIQYRILIQEGAGAFVERANREIGGRYPTLTVFQHFFQVDPTVDQYSVRIEKISDDSTDPQTIRNLQWLTLTEITQKEIAYIGTALVWYNFNSELFQSDPEVELFVAGQIFSIPSNSQISPQREDRGLNFNGGWDGTFYTPDLATTDPAWAVYSLLTLPRESGGLGFPPSQINKFDLYQCSVYNNVLISDGFGGLERRYSFNGLITQQQISLETIRSICATFATKIYWDGSQLRFWQQRPTQVLPRVLCNADVRDGKFTPSQGEYQALTTACKVWYTDPSNSYDQSPEPVEVTEAINQYGYFQEEFTALGVITRGAAIRTGRRIIYNSLPKYNKQISFECRPHAIFFKPGEVIQIADSARGRKRMSGLISSATQTQIFLDAPTEIINNNATILVTLTDQFNNIYTEERNILNQPGVHKVIDISPPLPVSLDPHTTWQIIDGTVGIFQYQILSIEPSDNPLFFSITAKLYDSSLEEKIENSLIITNPPIVISPPSVMPPPNNLIARFSTSRINANWGVPARPNGDIESYARSYIAEYKKSVDGIWGNRINTTNAYVSWNLTALSTDIYFVRVAAVSTEGKTSQWIEAQAVFEQSTGGDGGGSGSGGDGDGGGGSNTTQVNADWNATSGVQQILNKPNLALVATSGSYLDLINKPSLINLQNGIIVNGISYLNQSVKPTTRVDGSSLIAGDRWYNPSDFTEWFWNGTYWLSNFLKSPVVGSFVSASGYSITESSFFPSTNFFIRVSEDFSILIEKITIARQGSLLAGNIDQDNRFSLNLYKGTPGVTSLLYRLALITSLGQLGSGTTSTVAFIAGGSVINPTQASTIALGVDSIQGSPSINASQNWHFSINYRLIYP